MKRKPAAPKRSPARKAKAEPKGLRAFRLPGKAKATVPTPGLAARRLAAARAFAAEEPPELPRQTSPQATAPSASQASGAAPAARSGPSGTAGQVVVAPDGDFEVKVAKAAPLMLPEELAGLARPRAPTQGSPGARQAEEAAFEVKGGTPRVEKAEDGLQVVAKGPSKFTAEDLELLKRLIVPKGQAIIDGFNLDAVKYNDEGLVPVIAQDRATGAVVAQSWANREALEKTLRSRQVTYWNRKADKLVVQGEESGQVQKLVRLVPDCDGDAILAVVDQDGPACHRDTGTCWSDGKSLPVATALGELDRAIGQAKGKGNRTAHLVADPVEAMKGLVEQTKVVVAALRGKQEAPLEAAAAQLLHNLLVACRARGVGLEAILRDVATLKVE